MSMGGVLGVLSGEIPRDSLIDGVGGRKTSLPYMLRFEHGVKRVLGMSVEKKSLRGLWPTAMFIFHVLVENCFRAAVLLCICFGDPHILGRGLAFGDHMEDGPVGYHMSWGYSWIGRSLSDYKCTLLATIPR
jgi:hypothetical protein